MNDIVEVNDTRSRDMANQYLANGYRLLAVPNTSRFIEREGHPGWVQHGWTYVVGRPVHVPPFSPLTWQQQQDAVSAG